MPIVLPRSENWNDEIKTFLELPLIFVGKGGPNNLYFLVKNTSDELEKFINTGCTDAAELNAITEEEMRMLMKRMEELKFRVEKCCQRIEYMKHSVIIHYPQIINPKTGDKISLIPWFMLPGRPFPAFIYIYAIWNYYKTGEKSLAKTAAATGKLFGIKGFNKSTVSRSIKAFSNIIDLARISAPLPTDEAKPSDNGQEAPVDKPELAGGGLETPKQCVDEKLLSHIPEILNGVITVEALKEQYGEKMKLLPKPINDSGSVKLALSGITGEYSTIIVDSGSNRGDKGDRRKRPARPHNRGMKRMQRSYTFEKSTEIKVTRVDFIKACRCLVMNSATIYHTFLN